MLDGGIISDASDVGIVGDVGRDVSDCGFHVAATAASLTTPTDQGCNGAQQSTDTYVARSRA